MKNLRWFGGALLLGAWIAFPPAFADCASGTSNLEDCLQCCQDNYTDNLERCKRASMYCTFSLPLIGCLAWSTNPVVYDYCAQGAAEVDGECRYGCPESLRNPGC
mgnify:CR=1 FL=1